jgi:GAF domain-containing protein
VVQSGNDPTDIRKELAILTAAHNRADRAEAEARAALARATAAEALAAIAQARAEAAEATVQELRQAIRARDAAEQARRPGSLLEKLNTALRGVTTAPSR